MSAPIIKLDQLEFNRELRHGDRFEAKLAPVGPKLGARKLGYNVTSVAPGRRASPFHNRDANEERFFVLEGSGTRRFGAGEYPLRKGDSVCCPPGAPAVAQQLINTGAVELSYIAVSTMIDTEVWRYPHSGKFGPMGSLRPGWPPQATFEAKFVPEGASVDYWQQE